MSVTNPEHIKITVRDTGVAIIQLNRPEKRNAFNQSMIVGLAATLSKLNSDDAVRAVVLTGGPNGPFCAGMDLKELITISTSEAYEREFLKDLTDAFARFTKPVIAAVVGYALGGGCEIALACDIIYAAEDASFGLPEIKIGTIPGAGGTQRIARAIGKHRAMEFVLTGDPVSGREFHTMGVINKVFHAQDTLPAAIKLAERIAANSRPVIKAAKQAVLTVENSHLDAGMIQEKSFYYSTFNLADFKEGLTAFLEKRKPVFTHQ